MTLAFLGMDVINDALEAAVNAKDKSEWTPVSVNVAPATLTILSKQVREAPLHGDFLSSSSSRKIQLNATFPVALCPAAE